MFKNALQSLQWGSEAARSAQSFEGEWYMQRIGDLYQVSNAARSIFVELLEDDTMDTARCPTIDVIAQTMTMLSKNGIPTMDTDGVIAEDKAWTGDAVTAASLIGALRIDPRSTGCYAVLLFTSTGMARAVVTSYGKGAGPTRQRAHLTAGILKAFGGTLFSNCGYTTPSKEIGYEEGTSLVTWDDAIMPIEVECNPVCLRFPLFGNAQFAAGVYRNSGALSVNELFFSSEAQQHRPLLD